MAYEKNKLPVEHFATTTFKTTYYAPPVPHKARTSSSFSLKKKYMHVKNICMKIKCCSKGERKKGDTEIVM